MLIRARYCLIIILLLLVKFSYAQVDINAMEYFIDTDPGIGAATSVPVTNGATIQESFTVPTSALPVGFHTLYIRVQDLNSEWSISESRSFYVSASRLDVQADVQAMEYFIDTDPGIGAGTSLPITVGTDIDLTTIIPTSLLAAGFHTLHLRSRDSDGVWSEVESRSFFVDALSSSNISGIEYFFDTDPGIGGSSSLPITPPQATIDSTVNIPTTSLTAGPHVMGIRLVNENGLFGMTGYYNITLCDGAIANILADTVCIGSSTLFTDLSTNVQVGDVYSWDFDSDGSEDDNTVGDKTFTYGTPGTYRAAVSINRVGCIAVDTIDVFVEAPPVADAGVDQALCSTSTTLTGSNVGANEAGVWSIFAGSGVIQDPLDNSSMINAITSSSIELVWEITNTIGGCSDADTVLITPNLPIVAQRQTSSVNIGESTNINVQVSATINSGDVIVSSIESPPAYGIAALQADGTISYTPDLDAPALDSLAYRLTNQCSNFSIAYAVLSITNAPPVVQSTLPSPQVGTVNVTIDISNFISDPNNNIDYSSLTIITQPISGAIASIDGNNNLTIDYSAITYRGDDLVEIRVCDLTGTCVNQLITIPGIDVGGENPPITVYNGVSPDGDGHNDYLEIENIEFYPDNTVIILNRWGAEIERIIGYNNQDRAFKNNSLPSGTYYYHILPGGGNSSPITGHFLLHTSN